MQSAQNMILESEYRGPAGSVSHFASDIINERAIRAMLSSEGWSWRGRKGDTERPLKESDHIHSHPPFWTRPNVLTNSRGVYSSLQVHNVMISVGNVFVSRGIINAACSALLCPAPRGAGEAPLLLPAAAQLLHRHRHPRAVRHTPRALRDGDPSRAHRG